MFYYNLFFLAGATKLLCTLHKNLYFCKLCNVQNKDTFFQSLRFLQDLIYNIRHFRNFCDNFQEFLHFLLFGCNKRINYFCNLSIYYLSRLLFRYILRSFCDIFSKSIVFYLRYCFYLKIKLLLILKALPNFLYLILLYKFLNHLHKDNNHFLYHRNFRYNLLLEEMN